MDIFCKNQHGITSIAYQGDTSIELRDCVKGCGQTILACTPWRNPNCLRRIWCQYEVHHTNTSNIPLIVSYPSQERDRMSSGMNSWTELLYWLVGRSSEDMAAKMLWKTLSELRLTNARATIESDESTILSKIARDFGGNEFRPMSDFENRSAFHKANTMIRLALVNGINVAIKGDLDYCFPRQRLISNKLVLGVGLLQMSIVLSVISFYENIFRIYTCFAIFLGAFIGRHAFNVSATYHQVVALLEPSFASTDYNVRVSKRHRLINMLLGVFYSIAVCAFIVYSVIFYIIL
jgi:hypothetical protein